ncbi:tyrosine-type recombinase/integrase [Methylobacterium sp. WL30]|uniref:tyrosine-type recombinase/integrase n=1 Tax=unclassified Methylobacterium TaxID=2615210 RepID=UPI0011C9D475|nr:MULTISPECIES: site-specific integrase [unclassified Methylobacterium]TXN38736.1 tyrosine-type recombinase/integrase [Methylobacterium sp. WL93]TXN52230.1 tyrosine-type recombinase/integrase [Methylobacterium sp. WL119]TXN70687.1 tyrosine-type recombinase/integrase [Methylobacterium sp. WL30]
MRLTNQTVVAVVLPAGRDKLVVFDDDLPGFGLSLSKGGSRTWVVQYRNALGQSKRETLGKVGVLTASDARRAAGKRLARAKLGEDPHAEKVKAKARAAITFGAGVEPYLEAVAPKLRPAYLSEASRYLRTVWRPLHRLPLHSVGRQQIADRLAEIRRETGPHAANRARSALSAHFAWLVGTGAAELNPVIGVPKPAPEVRRARILTEDEVAKVLGACRNDDFGRIVRLLLLTGQRRDEVAGMAWLEVDLAGALWSLPAHRVKNGQDHDVPLSAPALQILTATEHIEGRTLVFGQGDGGFQGFSRAKAALDARAGVTGWRLHDLRRTAATLMADRLKVLPHVVEAVLNHISGHKAGVAGIYNRAVYASEKREALDLLGTYLAGLEPRIQIAAADAQAPLAKPKKRRAAPVLADPAKGRRT